ncbi:flagellar assembly protein FliX [Sphingobium subterraneum]|uniref:Flagellar assembly regulator FliX n=1 Tax=Sphingobium subterraneum TaxID=627688 RepID=A0A841J0E5_9SPHN|nr:flagellar assembly protein FliX [Sphingobium subterraneum]MBB6124317.1 hypothetical protein [Sphingobium subterraneum]
MATPPSADAGALSIPTSPTTLGSIQMLVALAAVSPTEERRRIQSAQARQGLDTLDRLHRELLSGRANRATLDQLAQWLQTRPDATRLRPDDPKFAALLDDIDLRIRVELAKFAVEG